jgi:DNA-binding NtrC family response regulator
LGKTARILIVDDDENIRKVLQAILEDERYNVETADTARKAIELLTRIRDTTPRMRKIIITGYPTLQNAIEAVNRNADAYIMKPFDVDKVLKAIEEQLKKQEEEKRFSENKVAEFIETRVRELDTEKQLVNKDKH